MCLTIPGKVVKVRGEHASVDYGRHGVRENISIKMVPAEVGDHVLVQGGFVIKILRARESRQAQETWKMIQENLAETDGGVF